MQIRKAKAEDRAGLVQILDSDETFNEDERSVALELIDDALSLSSQDYFVLIAQKDSLIAGYLCYGPTPMTTSTFDLYWVVVHAKARGQGIASKLIASMEEALLRDFSNFQVRVETSQSDGYEAARRLYARAGYPELARFKDFYEEGDDLVVFFKKV